MAGGGENRFVLGVVEVEAGVSSGVQGRGRL